MKNSDLTNLINLIDKSRIKATQSPYTISTLTQTYVNSFAENVVFTTAKQKYTFLAYNKPLLFLFIFFR